MVLITKIKTEMTLIINIRTEMFLIIGQLKPFHSLFKIRFVILDFGIRDPATGSLDPWIRGSRDPGIRDPGIHKFEKGGSGSRDPGDPGIQINLGDPGIQGIRGSKST